MRLMTISLGVLSSVLLLAEDAQAQRPVYQDKEVMNYRLSMEKLRKLVDVQRSLTAANAKNARLFDVMDGNMRETAKKNGRPLTVAQKAAIMDRNPEAKRVFTRAGWSAREWLLTTETMGDAYLSIEARKGTVSAPPPTTQAQKANVALLEQNRAEFQAIMEELDQLSDELLNQE